MDLSFNSFIYEIRAYLFAYTMNDRHLIQTKTRPLGYVKVGLPIIDEEGISKRFLAGNLS